MKLNLNIRTGELSSRERPMVDERVEIPCWGNGVARGYYNDGRCRNYILIRFDEPMLDGRVEKSFEYTQYP